MEYVLDLTGLTTATRLLVLLPLLRQNPRAFSLLFGRDFANLSLLSDRLFIATSLAMSRATTTIRRPNLMRRPSSLMTGIYHLCVSSRSPCSKTRKGGAAIVAKTAKGLTNGCKSWPRIGKSVNLKLHAEVVVYRLRKRAIPSPQV